MTPVTTLSSEIDRLLAMLPERAVSAKTAAAYKAAFQRLLRADGEIPTLRAHDRKRTYYYNRAALHFGSRLFLLDLREQLLRPGSHTENAGWLADAAVIVGRIARALALDPPREVSSARSFRWNAAEQRPDRHRRSSGKRHMLRLMPVDWREKLWEAIPDRGAYRDATAVMTLLGLRPAEFVAGERQGRWSAGVTVQLSARGTSIVISVDGAKVRPGVTGQERRAAKFQIDLSPAPARYLAERCRAAGGVLVVSIGKPDALRRFVERVGKRVFPSLRNAVTPYALRHAAIADAKATFGAGEAVAQFGGHASDSTQGVYAHRSQGRKCPGLLCVVSSSPVRKSGKLERARRFELSAGERRYLAGLVEQDGADPYVPRYEPEDIE